MHQQFRNKRIDLVRLAGSLRQLTDWEVPLLSRFFKSKDGKGA